MLSGGIIATCLALPWVNVAAAQQTITALPLDEALAKQAFALAENWVVRGQVPASTLAIPARGLAAVHATLRLDGLMLGQATALVAQPFQRDQTVDVMQTTRQAVAEALQLCQKKAELLNARSAESSLPTRLSALGPLLHLDLQFARPPTALHFDAPIELPRQFRLGRHGLAMTFHGQTAWLFPGNALAANLNLQNQIDRLAAKLHVPIALTRKLGRPDGPTLFRFNVIHLIRLRQGQPIDVLVRGRLPHPPTPVTAAELDQLIAGWVDHLIRRQAPSGWFAGTYQPSSNQYEPMAASAAECGLACYALAHFAHATNPASDRAAAARTAAVKAVTALTTVLLRDSSRVNPDAKAPVLQLADVSATLVALLETPGTAKLKPQRDRLAGAILAMQQPDGLFHNSDAIGSRQATVPTASLAAFAMARMYGQVRDNQFLGAARRAIDAILQQSPPNQRVATLPWLALAEFELARLDKPSPALITLRQTLIALLERQIRSPATRDGDTTADIVGGFRLDESLIPEPTWLSARPLMALAAALRVKDFVSDKEMPRWLLDVCRGIRFLDQLTMNADACYYLIDPSRAIGGVRSAMWDNHQPLAATALALLAGTELTVSLDEMK